MKIITIVKFPDKKKEAICVRNHNENVLYVVGYINHNKDMFIQALVDSKNIEYRLEEELFEDDKQGSVK